MIPGTLPITLLWLLPLLFALHDGEETLFLSRWLRRHQSLLIRRFPTLAARLLPHLNRIGSGRFALIAGEELTLLLLTTGYASLTANYYPWLALLLAFTLHLVIHLVQACALRSLFPAVLTSLLCLPLCGGMLYVAIDRGGFSWMEVLGCAVAGVVVAGANLALLHWVATKGTH